MKFSVVIPLHNKAPYIQCTLESVLAQTFTDFEVIVVDDGSSDGSDKLVAAMTDPRLRLVRQANAGVSITRNHGIALARGEWVAFLDADDWLHPNYLTFLLATQKAYPEAGAVATNFTRIPHADGQWPPFWPVPAEPPYMELITDLPARWMAGSTLCSSAVAVRTCLLQQLQPCFPPGESQGEDLDLWFRLGEQTPIALTHASMVAYRVAVDGSLTAQHAQVVMPPFVERMRLRALSGALTPAQRESINWYVAQFEVSLARLAIATGQRLKGLYWLMRSRRAAIGTRWWLTAAMTCFCSRDMVKKWEVWRARRTFCAIDTAHSGQ